MLKLETLIDNLQAKGYACSTLKVLSGYRTPYYNKTIGNVSYSAHLYGKAADVYVDIDQDGMMDDLNRDGSYDYRDAKILFQVVNDLDKVEENQHLIGGLGLYGRTSIHSPFVHIDVRGYQARWGHDRQMKQIRRSAKEKKPNLN